MTRIRARNCASNMTAPLPSLPATGIHGQDLLRWTNNLLASITRAQALFIEGVDPSAVHAEILQGIVEATGSAKGVLAAVAPGNGGSPPGRFEILVTHGTSPDEDEEIRRVVRDAAAAGEVAIGACSRGWHCMSIPVFRGEQLLGVIAIAGSERPYSQDTASALEPILTAFAALMHAIRERELHRLAQASVARQNQLFETLSAVSPVGIFLTDANGMCTHFNKRWAEFTGMEHDIALGERWHASIHPQDVQRSVQTWVVAWRERAPFELEFRYLQPSGRVVWAFSQALPVFSGSGAYEGHVGVVTDITTQREHQQALAHSEQVQREASTQLRQLASHLLEVREHERTRIARELHDDLGQTLTALRMELGRVRAQLGREASDRESTWRTLESLLQRSITSLRETCADLRPAVLDDLGLAPAAEWLVRQVRERTKMQVDLSFPPMLPALPEALTTDLFRILQESLTNIVKHAGASRVGVSLRAVAGHLHMVVEDNGKGPGRHDKIMPGRFGILGMRERALRWQGSLQVGGPPSGGTRVELSIPIQSTHEERAHDPGPDRR